ncbi:MAG: TolC family protein [Hyphomonas sp.]|uniref:TolC family protein n=1 Tax=Hyphomonas sp. TaxID=87 RepID=UPI0017F6EB6C|nr:TolC family protein [Hyphomonas sp.]MBA3069197.1 TolC family protein [Hyphomonas sp.]MBU4061856.1 TolC family protein [Alphaproteobacteria bacterium]MBU4163312.1 TolC family protein [Alphaproteobacteria bacterium]MBU4567520.1 TolC family protein [Alphaproteobacteria bacterium]
MKRQVRRSSAGALAGGLLAALSGCAVGPDYVAPAPDLAGFHSADAPASREAATPAPELDSWWEGFNDPELTGIVQRALDQNLDLAAAMARVEQARAAARGAGAQRLPSFDISAQASRQRQSLESPTGAIASNFPGYDRDQSLYGFGGAASWEIDLFGGLARAADAATAEAQAAEATRMGTRISVAADAADAYLRIRGDQARIAIAADQIVTNARLLDLVLRRFKEGLAADREVAQTEALLAGARASLPPLYISLEAQLNRLDVLMGVQPGTYTQVLGGGVGIPAAPALASAAPTDMLRRRPDIIAAERRLAASNARIGAAMSDYYPKFSLAGLIGFESAGPQNLIRSETFQPQGVLGLRWRLFDFGRIDAQVAAAKGAEVEVLALYRLSVLRAAEDVENAFTTLVQLEAYVGELEREAAALERVRDLSQTAYEAGVIPLTDVLDANRRKLAAEDALARARVDVSRAAVSAFRALGGGWSSDTGTILEIADVHNQ